MIPRHSTLPPRFGSTPQSGTEALQAEIAHLSGELDALRKGAPGDGELAQLRAKFESSEADCQKLEEQLSKLRSDSEQNQSAETRAVREEARKERELRKRLEQEFHVTCQRLDGEITVLKDSRQKQVAESNRREEELQAELEAARRKSDQEANDTRKELDAQRQKLTEATTSAETAGAPWQEREESLNRECEILQRRVLGSDGQLEEERQLRRSRETEFSQSIEALKMELESRHAMAIAELQAAIQDREATLDKERNSQQEQRRSHENELEALRQEVDSDRGRIEKECEKCLEQLKRLHSKELEASLESLRTLHTTLSREEADVFAAREATFKRQTDTLAGELESARNSLSEKNEELNRTEAVRQALEQEFAAKDSGWQKNLQDQTAIKEKLSGDLESARNFLSEKNEELKRDEAARQALEQEFAVNEAARQKNLQDQTAIKEKLSGDLESARNSLSEKNEELKRDEAARQALEREFSAKESAWQKNLQDQTAIKEKLSGTLESARESLSEKNEELKRDKVARRTLEREFSDKEAAGQKVLENQNRQKEALSREHKKEFESLSRELESARKSLEEGKKKLVQVRTAHQAREKQLKDQLNTLSVSAPAPAKPSAAPSATHATPKPMKQTGAEKPRARPKGKSAGEGKSVQDLVKEESAVHYGRPAPDSAKQPAPAAAKRKEAQKPQQKQPEPAPAIPAAEDAIAARPMSGLLVLGWLSLLAGIGLAIAVPRASNLTTGAIGAALLIGLFVLLRRRTPLVFGLIVLSVLMPPMFAAGVSLGYRGLFPQSRASSAPGPASTQAGQPKGTSTPENAPRISLGESVIVDGVEISFDGVRLGPVMVRAFIGDDIETLDDEYLIIDLTLRNTVEDRPLHLDNPWERSRISDSYGEYSVIVQQRQGLVHVEGTLGSIQLEPDVTMSDMIIFEMPDDRADDFHFFAEPGFSTLRPDGMYENISPDIFRLSFKRSDIQAQQ